MFSVTKTYGHDLGLSACFRQHRATHSHCSLLHGYALSFQFVFAAAELDHRNWVLDFGNLDALKGWLKETFDHKLLVAVDDPQLDHLAALQGLGLADVLVLPRVGCEAFAHMAFLKADAIASGMSKGAVHCVSCKVSEHGANSATYSQPVAGDMRALYETLFPPIEMMKAVPDGT